MEILSTAELKLNEKPSNPWGFWKTNSFKIGTKKTTNKLLRKLKFIYEDLFPVLHTQCRGIVLVIYKYEY